ncbi:MAG TPA: methylated-DNA--[protein]-cysteine S-methyltransferase [Oligoflexia bacterium]|nr:methylated-DNA--[protein]-cysteine S-methyltransferase [Oligoflexia bacterium]
MSGTRQPGSHLKNEHSLALIEASVNSPLGRISLFAGEAGLIACAFSDGSKDLKKKLAAHGFVFSRKSGKNSPGSKAQRHVRAAQRAVTAYFRGSLQALDRTTLAPCGTTFQKQVWKALCAVPAGQTRSYAAIAARLGKHTASRAAANACGANPLPLFIPCHRIIRTGGELGGYSGGTAKKKFLLHHEAAWRRGRAVP